jgi:hypothetical protein
MTELYNSGDTVVIISAMDPAWIGREGEVTKRMDYSGQPVSYKLDIGGGDWEHSSLALVKKAKQLSLEDSIKDIISRKLTDGTVERSVEKYVEEGINHALKDLFGSYGDVTKVIEKQVKSVMVPYLENYDYSRYITKLDEVLIEVLKHSAIENKELLDNFKDIITAPSIEKEIKMSDIFKQWMKYVADNVETDGLEIDYDDEPSYEAVGVWFEVEEDEDRYDWSIYKNATVKFECEHDEKMNAIFKLSRWKDSSRKGWDIEFKAVADISSLRYLDKFSIFLLKLKQNNIKVILDEMSDNDSVRPEKQPEADWS